MKSGMGRTARTARASRRRAGAATGARHGRLRASQAPSGVPRNSYRPWGHLGPLGRGVAAYGVRDTVKMKNHVRMTHATSRIEGGMVDLKSYNRAKPLILPLRIRVWGIQNAQDHCLTRHWTRDMPLASPFKKYDGRARAYSSSARLSLAYASSPVHPKRLPGPPWIP